MRGTITIGQCKTGIIQIGFNSFGFIVGHGEALWSSTAEVHFKGKTRIGCNPKFRMSGLVTFGHNFEAGHDLLIICQKEISFKQDVLLSWSVSIMDADGHRIYDECENEVNEPRAIHIASHTWVGCYATILKGSILPADTIIASHSVTTKKFTQEGCVIAGNPGKVIKTKQRWQ